MFSKYLILTGTNNEDASVHSCSADVFGDVVDSEVFSSVTCASFLSYLDGSFTSKPQLYLHSSRTDGRKHGF